MHRVIHHALYACKFAQNAAFLFGIQPQFRSIMSGDQLTFKKGLSLFKNLALIHLKKKLSSTLIADSLCSQN